MADIQASILGTAPADYAGDVSADEAWRVLGKDQNALLVDVRTAAEWAFVGVPDLSSLNKEALCIEWQTYPSMEMNAAFVNEVERVLERAGRGAETNLFMICRSGARSRSAATALSAAGFKAAYNVVGGFEGDLDEERHRGRSNGWKASGLPWRQS
ncbi:MAG: rhodanese-like domain-containing protein [Parvibaculaceae bacterium]